jgi:hypothetical protein
MRDYAQRIASCSSKMNTHVDVRQGQGACKMLVRVKAVLPALLIEWLAGELSNDVTHVRSLAFVLLWKQKGLGLLQFLGYTLTDPKNNKHPP